MWNLNKRFLKVRSDMLECQTNKKNSKCQSNSSVYNQYKDFAVFCSRAQKKKTYSKAIVQVPWWAPGPDFAHDCSQNTSSLNFSFFFFFHLLLEPEANVISWSTDPPLWLLSSLSFFRVVIFLSLSDGNISVSSDVSNRQPSKSFIFWRDF